MLACTGDAMIAISLYSRYSQSQHCIRLGMFRSFGMLLLLFVLFYNGVAGLSKLFFTSKGMLLFETLGVLPHKYCHLLIQVFSQTGFYPGIHKLFLSEWTEWEDITDSGRDPNWMLVHPLDEIMFSVQTNVVGYNQGIRFYVRSSPDDATGTYVNINIPENSGKSVGSWVVDIHVW